MWCDLHTCHQCHLVMTPRTPSTVGVTFLSSSSIYVMSPRTLPSVGVTCKNVTSHIVISQISHHVTSLTSGLLPPSASRSYIIINYVMAPRTPPTVGVTFVCRYIYYFHIQKWIKNIITVWFCLICCNQQNWFVRLHVYSQAITLCSLEIFEKILGFHSPEST